MLTGGVGASIAGSPNDVRAEVAALLGVSADTVDPASNLISQGLDSIRMMSLAGKWRRRGIDVDFAALSAEPTIEAWSRLVGVEAHPDATEPDVPAAPTGPAAGGAFPLAPMQHAMWVGRHDSQPLGGVAGHLYVEFDGGAIDPERLAAAATSLAMRHPMLRVRFLPDGTQQIDTSAQSDSAVTVHDFRDLAQDAAGERLLGLREAKSHQQLDGEVFELTLSLLPGEKSRLHVDLDMQAADAMSYRTLMTDLAILYEGRQLPELGFSYREYRNEIARREAEPRPAHDADRDWCGRTAFPSSRTRRRSRRQTEDVIVQQYSPLAVVGSRHPGCAVRTRPLLRGDTRDDVRRGLLPHLGVLVEHLAFPAERAAVRS